MTDQSQTKVQIAQEQGQLGFGKISAGIISGFLSSYLMTQLSLRGVDFTVGGVSSEVVKSAINGTLIGFFVGFTPKHFVAYISDCIIFVKQTCRTWSSAWKNNE